MRYNFDKITDRRGSWSIKHDFAPERGLPEGLLPLWVADMDFPSPPEVLADLQKAVRHGVFGYTEPKEEYYNALISWFGARFNYHIAQNEIIKAPGVVFSIAHTVRALTNIGDGVIIQTPVYYPFYSLIADNGRKIVKNPLLYTDGKYHIDFADFENKIIGESVKLFILCSPHNPVGRVWSKDELIKLRDICKKHGVTIVSDEIHCDFIAGGNNHTCFGLLEENAVVATSPSKTFNLAGLQVSHLFVKNKSIRNAIIQEIKKSGSSQLSALGLAACRSAYEKGGPWLSALNKYIAGNIEFVRSFLDARLPKIRLVPAEGTYLIWLDFSAYELSPKQLDGKIITGAKLWLDGGTMFGEEGAGFQRINIACPRATLRDAMDRLYHEFR